MTGDAKDLKIFQVIALLGELRPRFDVIYMHLTGPDAASHAGAAIALEKLLAEFLP